jgi:hypothetical protein
MVKIRFISFIIFSLPFLGISQTLENLDYISPFHEDLAAIQKGDQWAIIDTDGSIVIDFRSDLVSTVFDYATYPIFRDGLCLIEKDGIVYFGYINTLGETVIEPQFINASNFKDEKAIVLKLIKETAGENTALGKNVVYYKYFEVIINKKGDVLSYLTKEGQNIVLDDSYLRNPPQISFSQISELLFVRRNKNEKLNLIKLDY